MGRNISIKSKKSWFYYLLLFYVLLLIPISGCQKVPSEGGTSGGTSGGGSQGGSDYSMVLEAKPPSIYADGLSFTTIQATIKDIYGKAIKDGTYIYFSTVYGNFFDQAKAYGTAYHTQTSQGQAFAKLRSVPNHTGGFFVTVSCPGEEIEEKIFVAFTDVPVQNFSGTVVDSDGNPIENAVIYITPLNGGTGRQKNISLYSASLDPNTTVAYTDSSGNYVADLPPGDYIIKIVKDNYVTYVRTVTITDGSGEQIDVVINNEAGSSIQVGARKNKIKR